MSLLVAVLLATAPPGAHAKPCLRLSCDSEVASAYAAETEAVPITPARPARSHRKNGKLLVAAGVATMAIAGLVYSYATGEASRGDGQAGINVASAIYGGAVGLGLTSVGVYYLATDRGEREARDGGEQR